MSETDTGRRQPRRPSPLPDDGGRAGKPRRKAGVAAGLALAAAAIAFVVVCLLGGAGDGGAQQAAAPPQPSDAQFLDGAMSAVSSSASSHDALDTGFSSPFSSESDFRIDGLSGLDASMRGDAAVVTGKAQMSNWSFSASPRFSCKVERGRDGAFQIVDGSWRLSKFAPVPRHGIDHDASLGLFGYDGAAISGKDPARCDVDVEGADLQSYFCEWRGHLRASYEFDSAAGKWRRLSKSGRLSVSYAPLEKSRWGLRVDDGGGSPLGHLEVGFGKVSNGGDVGGTCRATVKWEDARHAGKSTGTSLSGKVTFDERGDGGRLGACPVASLSGKGKAGRVSCRIVLGHGGMSLSSLEVGGKKVSGGRMQQMQQLD